MQRSHDPEHAFHDADLCPRLHEPRSLFDVEFEASVDVERARFRLAVVADAAEFVADPSAIGVGCLECVLQGKLAGEHAAPEERRVEPGSLLVRPVGDRDGTFGLDSLVVQRPERLQGREHAQLSVVATAVRLRVGMRSDQHRRVVVGARTATEDVSDAVDPNVQPRRFEILDETVPGGLVSICQREPVESVVFSGTDRRVLLERLPKPIVVYREHSPRVPLLEVRLS